MKPIIMSTEDVRGILDGRKTMKRVVIKPRYGGNLEVHGDITGTPRLSERCGDRCRGLVPPYEVGDVLWVRETWARLSEKEYLDQADDTDVNVWKIWRNKGVGAAYDRWMSPVTMPREASRLFLRVKDVRVEKNEDSGQWVWVIEFERIEKGAES